MHLYQCKKCGHEVVSKEKPDNIRWTDGHVCIFSMAESNFEEEMYDDGFGMINPDSNK